MKKLILGIILCLSANAVLAAGGGVVLDSAPINLNSKQSLQNGAKLFVNYCQACHSAKFMRYKRLMEDLDLTEEQVLSEFTFDPNAKIGDLMTKGASSEDQKVWFNDAEPPDLSVISRVYGADWLYTFLRAFYKDDSRPLGWGNTVKVVNMPHPFWSLQGTQELIEDESHAEEGDSGHGAATATANLKITKPGTMTEQEFDDAMADLTTFLVYLGEPGQMARKSLGWKVIIYLALFTFLAYLLKVEYWRDIH